MQYPDFLQEYIYAESEIIRNMAIQINPFLRPDKIEWLPENIGPICSQARTRTHTRARARTGTPARESSPGVLSMPDFTCLMPEISPGSMPEIAMPDHFIPSALSFLDSQCLITLKYLKVNA